MHQFSIRRKILLAIGGSTLLLVILFALFGINHITTIQRDKIDQAVNDLVAKNAQDINRFYSERARVAWTVFSGDELLTWFDNHTEKLDDPSVLPQYNTLVSDFKDIVKKEATISSVFVALKKSREYIDHSGRAEDYNPVGRPFWQKAMKHADMTTSSPMLTQNNEILTAVQAHIFSPSGEFLGIAGVDILIDTLKSVINTMRYQNDGQAFLIDQNSNIVFFPQSSGKKLELNQPLNELDSLYNDTKGFSKLATLMRGNNSGVQSLTWQGKHYQVYYQPVSNDMPVLNWQMGMMIPNELIDDPVQAVWVTSLLLVAAIALLLLVVIHLISASIVKPLNQVVNSMEDIAQGDGDLTQRLTIKTSDEVGMLANQFNHFIDKVHHLVKQSANTSHQLNDSASSVSQIAARTNDNTVKQQQEIELVSTAVTEMAASVQEISNNATATRDYSDNADEQAIAGREIVSTAVSSIDKLAHDIENASEVVKQLREDSLEIGSVLEVIRNIAEQTNLLALNAAIEAARAGEQGRGFAVVADEVRTLASRTQESTTSIQQIIEQLQERASNAENMMIKGNEQAISSVEHTNHVQESLGAISGAISQVRDMSAQIAASTKEQSVAVEEINQNIVRTSELAHETAETSENMTATAAQLTTLSNEQMDLVNQFKI